MIVTVGEPRLCNYCDEELEENAPADYVLCRSCGLGWTDDEEANAFYAAATLHHLK